MSQMYFMEHGIDPLERVNSGVLNRTDGWNVISLYSLNHLPNDNPPTDIIEAVLDISVKSGSVTGKRHSFPERAIQFDILPHLSRNEVIRVIGSVYGGLGALLSMADITLDVDEVCLLGTPDRTGDIGIADVTQDVISIINET